MKKKRIQLIILLILCLLCAAAYLIFKSMDFSEKDTAAEEVAVTDFASKDVTSLSVSGDHRLNFAKEEDKWVNTDDREMPLNQTLVSSLVNNIAGITTESVVEQPEDLSEYGLDNPVRTIKATLENGSSIIIYVGNQNDLTGDYYIRLYGISSYVVKAFDKEPEEFIEETEEETTSAEDTEETAAETANTQETE